MNLPIPTEPVGSLPAARPSCRRRTPHYDAGDDQPRGSWRPSRTRPSQDSIERMEATGSPIVSDGEQRCVELRDLPDHRHARRHRPGRQPRPATASTSRSSPTGTTVSCPRLTGGPFRYKTFAADYAGASRCRCATKPMKQAVIAPSMLALLYPLDEEVAGYSREEFEDDLRRRVREGHPPGVRGRRRPGLDRLHRGPAGRPATTRATRGPDAGMLAALHRAEQPRASTASRAEERVEHRHPHVPRRRPRLGAQRRRADYSRPAAEHVQDERRLLPDPARQRAGQGPRCTS